MEDIDGSPRRRKSDETTKRLLDAAAEVFIEKGYDKAVVSDIARRAGMTTGAVFARWPTKSDVMGAAADHIFSQILPEQRLRDFGIEDLPAFDIFSAWASRLLTRDDAHEVLVQAFGSARNNDAVGESLQRFLSEQADQLQRLIERGRQEGQFDPALCPVAQALYIQAIGIGTHLLLSAGREDRQIPSQQNWAELLDRMLKAAHPPGQ